MKGNMYDALRATFDNPHCNVVQIIAVFLTGNSPSGLTSRKHKLLLVVFKNRSALPCGWALFLCVATDHRHLAVNHNGNMSQDTLLEVNSPAPIQQFLSQLNSNTWSQVLLPKLIEQGSAGAVALTCSQLRDIMYHGVQQIDLSSLPELTLNSAEAKWLVHSLPQHFPGCSCVRLYVNSRKACIMAGGLLPALRRLPSLSSITLTVQSPLSLTALRTLLSSMQKQVKCMRSLYIDANQSWAGSQRIWQALGKSTQLTELHINFNWEVDDSCTGQDLATQAACSACRH